MQQLSFSRGFIGNSAAHITRVAVEYCSKRVALELLSRVQGYMEQKENSNQQFSTPK